MPVVTVGDQGQIALPSDVRAMTGIEDGSDLLIVPHGADAILLRRLPPRESVLALAAQYAQEGPAPTPQELDAIVAQAIEAAWSQRVRES